MSFYIPAYMYVANYSPGVLLYSFYTMTDSIRAGGNHKLCEANGYTHGSIYCHGVDISQARANPVSFFPYTSDIISF